MTETQIVTGMIIAVAVIAIIIYRKAQARRTTVMKPRKPGKPGPPGPGEGP